MNKAIQRSLTKACARHGLGLYIYAGEDLPEAEQTPIERPEKDTAAEMGLVRNQILAMADGDIDRINTFIEKKTNGQFHSTDGMTLEQLRSIKVAITKAKQNASK